jgi:hypothetical protein
MVLLFLSVVNCGHPESLLWRIGNFSVPNIDGYDGLSLEESTITFSCPPGMELTGSNSAICTGNGEWELNTNTWPTCVESKGYALHTCKLIILNIVTSW